LPQQIGPAVPDSPAVVVSPAEFDVLWRKLCEAYPRQETTTLMMAVYYERLSACEPKDLSGAIGECLDEIKFFPSIAEILAKIKKPRGCVHHLQMIEIRQREEAVAKQEAFWDKRLAQIGEEVDRLNGLKLEALDRKRKLLEQSGLPQAERKLKALEAQIKDAESTYTVLQRKIQLLDQANFLRKVEEDTDKQTRH
jgi:transposase-like protein